MDLLNKQFISQQVLKSEEMNQISVKIDEIIAYLNTQQGDNEYRVRGIVGDGESTYLYYLRTDETAMLSMSATSSVYSKTTKETHDYVENYLVKVEIDRGVTGSYIVIKDNEPLLYNQTKSIDIKSYLTTSQSMLRVTIKGVLSGASFTWNGYAQLTTMSMTPANVGWNTPFIEGTDYSFGSFTITGALEKVVHVNVTGNGYSASYTDNIGTRTFASSYYFRFGDEQKPSVSGVYDVEIYVDSGILESKHYTYQIMYVSAADAQRKQLVCVNDVGTKVTNASNSYFFAFAIYNGGSPTGSPIRTITARYENVDHEISEETLSLATGIKHSLNYYLDITTGDNAPTVTAKMTYGNEVSKTLPVDNSASYPPTAGAVFRMNAATRSNSQANRESIVNDAGTTSYPATWTKMAFVDGMDGWTIDDNGRSCLAVNAGSKVDINYAPLSEISSTRGKTIVLTYKVKNVSNYGERIITIADTPTSDRFVGLRITPEEICLHSSNKNTEDTKQNYHFQDEETVNATIVIAPNYRTDYGNFAQIYVNGGIKCEFSWSTSDTFANGGHIILGSETADLYVYSIEVYDNTFAFSDAHVNYVASLPNTDAKAAETERDNSVIDDSNEIDFEKVAESANYFVIEMVDGKSVPNFSEWNKKDDGLSNLEMHYHDHPTWDWKILNVETMGQGTTSMNYFRWNLRWRIDKSTNGGQSKYCYVQYDYNRATGEWGSTALSKTVKFDREHEVNGKLLEIMRITAKKNYASSQQSHKMGTTSAYNDLRKEILGDNEAGGRTAVFQVPAYGFAKHKVEGTNNYYYEFIGLFTIGPDKGDKPTFAYDNKTYKDTTLITMEGVDHDKRLAVFRYPWNNQVKFAEESLCIDMGNGTYETGWEVGNCCGETTDGDDADNAKVLAKMVTEFKPAYDIAYKNSPFIMGLAPTQYTLASINADINAFGVLRNVNDDYRPFNHYEFYFDGEYDLYFLNVATKQYEKKTEDENLLTDLGVSASSLLGLTLAQKDERFRELRRARFKEAMNASNSPWNLQDCLFTHTFLTIFGATDNHAKNSYPYRFLDKFCWRQDDLDTIFDTDNQGHSTKKYSIEFKDWTDSVRSAYVYKGEDSSFWTLIEQCYESELRTMGNRILAAMATLSSVKTGNTIDRLMGFFQDYYWNNAQDYFTKSAYNLDARYSYEEASRYFPTQYNPGVSPLEQSHGDSLESEKRWVERRLIYVMSKYRYGSFVNYTDVSLGRIAFRSQVAQAFTLKPAMDLYPVIITGANSAYFYGSVNKGRTWDGTECTMTNVGGGNTDVYLMAADYLRSIGDLCQLSVDSMNASLTVSSKRLETLKVGDVDATRVTSNLKALTLDNCPSLLTIDARNLTNLTDELNLVNCPRVRDVYLGGTDVRTVNFAQGCKVTTYELSNSITSLVLNDLKFLTSVDTSACADKIIEININGCDALNSFQVMYDVWSTTGNKLSTIRVTDVDIENASDGVVEMLYKISAGLDYGGHATTYKGRDAEGNITDKPFINGRVSVNTISTVYYNAITSYFPNLVIEGEKETPSVDDIGLQLVGDTSTMMENAVESRQFSVTAKKDVYRNVTWTGQFPNVDGATFSSNGLLSFASTDVAANNNISTSRTIKVIATSIYNSSAQVIGDILLMAQRVNSITLSASSQRLLTGGTAEVNATLLPVDNTKGKFLAYRSEDESVATITQGGTVTAVAQGFGMTNIIGFLTCDTTMFGSLRIVVNDRIVINGNDAAFTDLMAYIASRGWSEESNVLYLSEAENVTTLNLKLKGKTGLVSFTDFQYFTGVTSLAASEFDGCTNLAEIELPESITSLGSYVFRGCTSLTYINLKSLTHLPVGAFQGCTSLTTVFAPSSIVGARKGMAIQGAWGGGTRSENLLVIIANLENYLTGSYFMNTDSVPFGVSGKLALGTGKDDYSLITNLVIPEGITDVFNFAFYGCKYITSVNFNDVTSIGTASFAYCNNLVIDTNDFGQFTYIAGGAFRGCSISGVVNLQSLTSMGDNLNNTFADTGVTGAYFKTWHDWMMLDFLRMGGWTSTHAENYLKNIYIGNTYETKELMTSVDMSAYNIIRNRLFVNNQSITEITGTQNIKYLGMEAFVRCRHIKKIDLHNVTTFIQSGTSEGEIVEASTFIPTPFNQCPELEYVLLPKVVFSETAKSSSAMAGHGSIGNFCYGCNSIKVIDLGEGFERSNGYFRYRSSEYGISGWSVVTLVLRCKSVFILSNKSNVQHLQGKVYVPSDLVTTYQENSIWASAISSNYISGIYAIGGTEWTEEFGGSDPYYDYVYLDAADQAPYMIFKDLNIKSVLVANFDKDSDGELSQEEVESVTAFAGSLFNNNKTIKTFNELKYFKNVTAISTSCFQYSSLTDIDLTNILSISTTGFRGSSIQNVTNCDKLTSVGGNAFNNCKNLTSFNAPNLRTVGTSGFQQCTALRNFDFSNVTSIGGYGFLQCLFTEIAPTKCTSFGNYAFQNNTYLHTANITSATSIGQACFNGCSALETIYLPDTPPTLANTNAFPSTATFYVTSQSVKDAYLAATTWSDYDESRFVVME